GPVHASGLQLLGAHVMAERRLPHPVQVRREPLVNLLVIEPGPSLLVDLGRPGAAPGGLTRREGLHRPSGPPRRGPRQRPSWPGLPREKGESDGAEMRSLSLGLMLIGTAGDFQSAG